MTIKIGVSGATGRMGQEVINAARLKPEIYEIVATYSRKDSLQTLNHMCQESDVIIDFSSPDNIDSLVAKAAKYNTKLLIGTTGLAAEHFDLIKTAALKIGILYAPNTSLGANLIADLAARAAMVLGDNFDIDIIDIHHKNKKDAPSGTAIMIGKEIEETLHKQKGKNQMSIHSLRQGNIIGEHEIIFAGNSEVIKIKHQALDRSMFGEGALKAALWLNKMPCGLYSMKDVLQNK